MDSIQEQEILQRDNSTSGCFGSFSQFQCGNKTRTFKNAQWRNYVCSASRILAVRHRQKLCVTSACDRTKLLNKVSGHQIASYHPILSKEYSTNASSTEEEEEDDLYRLISLEMKGHDKAVLDSYTNFIVTAADELSLKCRVLDKTETPKVHYDRQTLLKSVHVNKTAMAQYEVRTHYRIIHFKHLTGTTVSIVLEYLERNLPEGVAVKVSKHRLERVPDHLVPPKEAVET